MSDPVKSSLCLCARCFHARTSQCNAKARGEPDCSCCGHDTAGPEIHQLLRDLCVGFDFSFNDGNTQEAREKMRLKNLRRNGAKTDD